MGDDKVTNGDYMKYVFYGVDMRAPSIRKEIIIESTSLDNAKVLLYKMSPFFTPVSIYVIN